MSDDLTPPIDPRVDPTVRDNNRNFWVGYGLYREGKWYSDIPRGKDYLAGWCYGLTEGRRKSYVPWYKSKTIWFGVIAALTGALAVIEPSLMKTDNSIPGIVLIVFAGMMAGFRFITSRGMK